MTDYENLWEYTQKCEAHIKQLESELARVKSFILEGECPDSWGEGCRVEYPVCGKCIYCEIKQSEGKW